MSHRIALLSFLILLSKLGNRKFYPTGICDEGDALVAVNNVIFYIIPRNLTDIVMTIFVYRICVMPLAHNGIRSSFVGLMN